MNEISGRLQDAKYKIFIAMQPLEVEIIYKTIIHIAKYTNNTNYVTLIVT